MLCEKGPKNQPQKVREQAEDALSRGPVMLVADGDVAAVGFQGRLEPREGAGAGIWCFGLSRPAPIKRRTKGRPPTTCQTSGCSEAARTRTRTSSSPTSGRATSRSSRSSWEP